MPSQTQRDGANGGPPADRRHLPIVFGLREGDDFPISLTDGDNDCWNPAPPKPPPLTGKYRYEQHLTIHDGTVSHRTEGSYLPSAASYEAVSIPVVMEIEPGEGGMLYVTATAQVGGSQVNAQAAINPSQLTILDALVDIARLPMQDRGEHIWMLLFRDEFLQLSQEVLAGKVTVPGERDRMKKLSDLLGSSGELQRQLEQGSYAEIERLKKEFEQQFLGGRRSGKSSVPPPPTGQAKSLKGMLGAKPPF